MKIDWPPHTIDRIVELYTVEDWSLKRLAEKYRVQSVTIRLLLTKQGVRIRRGGANIGAPKVEYVPTQEEIAAAIKPLRKHKRKHPSRLDHEKRYGKLASTITPSLDTIRTQTPYDVRSGQYNG